VTDVAATATGPLTGLLVADFTRVLAGPYCAMLLGDLGATVVKIEGPDGDETRHRMPPSRPGPRGDEATYYLSVNRSKRAVTLDFADDADLTTARALAALADVVIENFKPGGLGRLGLDYQTVRIENPRVLRLDQRVRCRIAASWLRRPRPGTVRLDERDRVAGR
jgi:crotonobetainyl-CoA:carnitine CoA-transferase CaiB-like acyl-CoA transferase